MIIFRVAQGIAWTSQTVTSDIAFTIHGMSGRTENLSIIQFQASTHLDEQPTDQPRNQSSLDGHHDGVLDTESNRPVTLYDSSTRDPAGIIEKKT